MRVSSPPTKDYDVGWICAIENEYSAVGELLDEEFNSPSGLSIHDVNAYIFGRIGDHYVVVACLAMGKYGLASAASVAGDMLRSFPDIRIRLMVGIGGGAPSKKHDVRLGDVVVSTPMGKRGGVVHYEFGSTVQDKMFQYVLYRLSFVHPNDDQSCIEICSQQPDQIVQRPSRDPNNSDPVIHYGLIGFADRLIKDAYFRDHLADTEGVLCFEMEAAGLMDRCQCVVIRGICDYSDTHKNDTWQGYAALTAAAYAKELLRMIPGNRVSEGLISVATYNPKYAFGINASGSRSNELEALLENLARRKGIQLNWKTSIVDLLKLLDLNSDIEHRKLLARELNIGVAQDGNAKQNEALRRAMMAELGKNGGTVPTRITNALKNSGAV
ncbi:hypothetical protein G7Y89_g12153 [Cudoniella acicularis]|uniref:Nucleoside phosphorylase domain-containing protein n=1 Tax=Cudoniella acicularis TaxID=354080 RepID=A0A8H4VZY0_9HELO|nr:hypothetical protein G7Y89_g12153 [Cudoniella acicularis]